MAQPVEFFGVERPARAAGRLDDLDAVQVQVELGDPLADSGFAAEQDRPGDLLVH